MMKKLLFLLIAVMGTSLSIKAQNLLATFNEGFEGIDAAATGASPYYWWGFYNNTSSNATLTDDPTNARTGNHAAKVVVGTAAQGYQPQLANGKTLTLVIGNTYTASFWIKAVTGGGTIQVSNSGTSLYGPNVVATTSWKQYSHTFTAATTSYQLWLHLGGFVDTYYIDDAAVVAGSVPLGLDNFNSKNIAIYPNPVVDDLNISSDSPIKAISITDINGKIVKTVKKSNIESVNLSELRQGMYILTTDENKRFKFLKK